jgi:hypothetical protein
MSTRKRKQSPLEILKYEADSRHRPSETRHHLQSIDDIRKGYFLYHLKWSRKAPAGPPVRQPRHLIAFYIENSDNIIVARVFHERQMLSRYLVEPDDH